MGTTIASDTYQFIPSVRWVTLELQMRKDELLQYAKIYTLCIRNLGTGFDDHTNTGIRNMYFHRRLCLAVFLLELDKMSCLDDKVAKIEKFYYQNQDHGAIYFLHYTKPQASLFVYRDRAAMAYYIYRIPLN